MISQNRDHIKNIHSKFFPLFLVTYKNFAVSTQSKYFILVGQLYEIIFVIAKKASFINDIAKMLNLPIFCRLHTESLVISAQNR